MRSLLACRYALMRDCWHAVPTARPSFVQLRARLSRLLDCSAEEYGYLYASDGGRSRTSTMTFNMTPLSAHLFGAQNPPFVASLLD